MKKQYNIDNAYSCILAAAAADAAGVTIEFYRGKITEEVVEKAMHMPGGGVFNVGQGQYSDDTELALSLSYSLSKNNPSHGFPLEDVARGYSEWYHSDPFDIGGTCSRAFSTKIPKDGNLANAMMRTAAEFSHQSNANGAAMRCFPIAIWSLGQPREVIAHYAKLDAMLSHPNQVCIDANIILVLACEYLIRNPGDYKGAIDYLDDYVKYNINSIVSEWYFKSSLNISKLVCSSNIGYVKWGFIQAIYYLRNNTPYEIALKEVLLRGGDTDTNGAIIGGILGALHGIDGIPSYMMNPVLAFDPTNPGSRHKRPQKYAASNISELVVKMLCVHNN